MRDRRQLADWGSRAGAALLDGIILFALSIAAAIVAIPSGGGWAWLLLTLVFAAAYYCGHGQRPEVAAVLREQLVVQRRMQEQYVRYDGELERMVIELDTVRANLVSTAASGDAYDQERLAERVRSLRDEMSAVAEGMDHAYGA
jgi:hypothetical protein